MKNPLWNFSGIWLAWGMFFVTANKSERLLFVSYAGHLRLEELTRRREFFDKVVPELGAGFRVLADFSNYESMEPDCMAEIGRVMDLFVQGGLAMSVRVIPDSRRDPGVNILTAFHYKKKKGKPIEVITCVNLEEAGKKLAL